jgi:CheY-like chemotaxis protein
VSSERYGLTRARRIRELENAQEITKNVPICGLTANARSSQTDSCIEAGMDGVVVSDSFLWMSFWFVNLANML